MVISSSMGTLNPNLKGFLEDLETIGWNLERFKLFLRRNIEHSSAELGHNERFFHALITAGHSVSLYHAVIGINP